ncbi:TetR/AcrR family transcriptional regulator [Nocardioides sp. KC13]|uniref:TetR/AcrR family transcriptional regulator n=1 Tax=Nocardioides turkmenicus TaxID=2711220 RepID=A0A6M1R095_9ACTN|nr:TetR/AcrR family transcriptional regulator [Nocardioides sp. KC13]NGN91149.1 TetR/AcrR family transcriptional regulator [Nocardioides sp. KC13]
MTTLKRADARKNIESIMDAATTCLARDPDVSVAEIAKVAGVGRVTLYGHFESRAALVTQVVERAIRHSDEQLGAIDLDGDPRTALSRLLEASWQLTQQYGALIVAAEQSMPHEQFQAVHLGLLDRWKPLMERGRRDGSFRDDQPLEWQLTLLQSVLHAASGAVYRGEIKASEAGGLVDGTVQAALTAPGSTRG